MAGDTRCDSTLPILYHDHPKGFDIYPHPPLPSPSSAPRYAAILYRNHPKGFDMYLRGKRIEPRNIVRDLKYVKSEGHSLRPSLSLSLTLHPHPHPHPRYVKSEVYTPSGQGLLDGRERKHYKIQVGFVKEAPSMDAQGFNLYHRNRLIKPMWEVYKSPSSVGRGVVGVVEVDFVQPSHDKQDFERTDAMMRLEAKLKLLAPSYWKEHGRRVGYQAANPLPKTERELQAEAAANRAAALEDDDDDVPGRLAASRLFGGRTEGGRKRKIARHLQDYQM